MYYNSTMSLRRVLINKINSSYWWHVAPQDINAYKKRGKFLASTYRQAEFYGKPLDRPERVRITNPLWSDSETQILKVLYPDSYQDKCELISSTEDNYYENRIALDSQMHKKAKELGYDCIVLLGSSGIKELKRNRKPRSSETVD